MVVSVALTAGHIGDDFASISGASEIRAGSRAVAGESGPFKAALSLADGVSRCSG